MKVCENHWRPGNPFYALRWSFQCLHYACALLRLYREVDVAEERAISTMTEGKTEEVRIIEKKSTKLCSITRAPCQRERLPYKIWQFACLNH